MRWRWLARRGRSPRRPDPALRVRLSAVCSRWRRTRARDEELRWLTGEALLEKGAVGHNHIWFRRYAIERALIDEEWGEAERQADALLLRTADEPLAYATCVATRARGLARRGRGDATEADEKALEQALAVAAASDVRIDALGIALRRK